MRNFTIAAGCGAIIACLIPVAVATAQPSLDPPPGPISLSGRFGPRTEITSIPITITNAGSYYLSQNLTGVSGMHGISVDASDVTIDLNGFALEGVAGSLDGIRFASTQRNLAVYNGSVVSWGSRGINLTNGSNCTLESLRVAQCGNDGIRTANGTSIRHCVSEANGSDGIVGPGTTIMSCVARNNGEDGIEIGTGGVMFNCTAEGNANRGIASASRNTITSCTSRSNGEGIVLFDGCTLIGSTASDNTASGIVAIDGSHVRNNTSQFNGVHGIQVDNDCLVIGNLCDRNGQDSANGAGIFANANSNRIDGNHVTGNDVGIFVSSTVSAIVRNSASGNTTNYSITAGNQVGPMTDASVIASPWANLDY